MSSSHIVFYLSETGAFSGPCYRAALTPHEYNTASTAAGVYNNFMQHNNGGWTPNSRWNFDPTKVGGNPAASGDEALKFEDIKKLEKVIFEFEADGLKETIYANGHVYSHKLVAEGGLDIYAAATFKVSFNNIADALCGHSTYAGEYLTIKKCYFIPAE